MIIITIIVINTKKQSMCHKAIMCIPPQVDQIYI